MCVCVCVRTALLLQSLVAGVLVLGAVQEVRDLDISISLPYNMCGTVAIGNVSDPITEGVAEEVEEEDEVNCVCGCG